METFFWDMLMCEIKLQCVDVCFLLFAGFFGEGHEPHAAQPHSGLYPVQIGLTGPDTGERQMLVGACLAEM